LSTCISGNYLAALIQSGGSVNAALIVNVYSHLTTGCPGSRLNKREFRGINSGSHFLKGRFLGRLYIKMLQVGMLGTNCYTVMDEKTKEGFIIDPGGDAKKVLETARSAGLDCRGVLCTHGHVDHVGAVGKVAEATGATVYISEPDSGAVSGAVHGLGARLGSLVTSKPNGFELLAEGDTLEFGEHTIKVLSTPGHTTGSLSFLCEDNLFCGDLVFEGSIGRTDLRGGSFEQLIDAVQSHVLTLPDEARIYPGHGPATTVGAERATNPFLRDLQRRR
jgi:hydroxyacylglutathione hydrolase